MAPTHPLSLNKSKDSELPNADVLSLFRQTTCSASASIHYNTLKVRKIYSYSESRKFVKTRIVHLLLLLLLLLLQFKRPTAKLGLLIALILSRKSFILECTWSLMHKIFIPSPKAVKLQLGNLTSVSFRRHFLVCSRAEHMKLVLCTNQTFSVRRAAAVSSAVLSFLATLLRFRLTVAGNWTCCCTQ